MLSFICSHFKNSEAMRCTHTDTQTPMHANIHRHNQIKCYAANLKCSKRFMCAAVYGSSKTFGRCGLDGED